MSVDQNSGGGGGHLKPIQSFGDRWRWVREVLGNKERRKSLLRGSGAMIFAASLSIALAGCENFYHHGPFALGLDGDQVLIASCEDLLVESAYLEERPDVPGNDGRRHVWEAGGRSEMRAGDVLVVGGDNTGLRNELRVSFSVIPGGRYFFASNSEEGDDSALFVIPDGGIGDGEWLSPEGEVQSTPCSAD